MYVECKNVVRSCDHCCSGKTTLHFVCVAELHVTGNYMQIECCTTMVLWQIYVTG